MPQTTTRKSRQRRPTAPSNAILLLPIPGIPEVHKGHDLAALIVQTARRARIAFEHGDVLVLAQKIVSKAEGRVASLAAVAPSRKAVSLARKLQNDPRFVEIVLRESRRIVRSDRVLIVETQHGFVCANAGVDRSNVPGRDVVTLLPLDPDRSAARLAADLRLRTGKRLSVVISDTFGRPWRLGLTNVAIGAAGVPALLDLHGSKDRQGKPLHATTLAVADELAAAAGLLMGKADGRPVVLIRGYRYRPVNAPAARIIRPAGEDLFR